MLKVTIRRKDKPIVEMFFDSLDKAKAFQLFIEDLIKGVRERTLQEICTKNQRGPQS